MSRLGAVALGLASGWVILSCGGKESPTAPPVVANIAVTPGGDTLATLGRTRVFAAAATDQNGNPVSATIRWHSTNAAVVTVDSMTGLVTAVANGAAIVRATASGVNGDAIVLVSQAVATVQVTPPASSFGSSGDTVHLTATAKDSGGAAVPGVRFLWGSSDPAVASVDTLGVVVTRAAGQATISATGRGIPGYAGVSVSQAPVHLSFSVPPPASVPVDQAFPSAVQVEVRDSSGQLATGARIAVTLSIAAKPGPGAIAGTTTVTSVGGVASFSGIALGGQSGLFRLSATSAGVSPDTSAAFTVLPGEPVSLVLDAPPTSTAGAAFQVLVQGFDVYGNLATASPDSIVLTGSSGFQGTLDRREAAVLAGGEAIFDSVVVDGPGLFTIVAADGAVSGSATTDASITLTTALFAGSSTACDLDTNGHAFCWGLGVYGQLGGGREVSSSVPRLVARDLVFTQLASGYGHTCGLVPGGDAYCWGLNNEGQLGNGVPFGSVPESLPVLVVGGHKFTEIAVGYVHTCGVTTLNEILCWGDDSRGELGSGKAAPSGFTGTPTDISSAFTWEHVTASDGFFTTCGLTGSGIAYCWGANEYGQLGDNSLVDDSVPVAVVGTVKFSTIATGGTHTCALALSDSTAYCWGTNGIGRAGTGMDSVAAPVDGGDHLHSLRSGGDRSCGQLSDNEVECWTGSLAPGVDPRWSLPEVIALTGDFECRSLTTVLGCLGSNNYGQLGNGTHAAIFTSFVDVVTVQPPPPAPRKR